MLYWKEWRREVVVGWAASAVFCLEVLILGSVYLLGKMANFLK